MNTPNFEFENEHQSVDLLLPWYLNKSLTLVEQKKVEKHLRSCLRCRRELTTLEKLASSVKRTSNLEMAAEVSFAGVAAKLPIRSDQSQASAVRTWPVWANVSQSKKGAKGRWGFMPNRKTLYPAMAIAASLLVTVIPVLLNMQTVTVGQDFYTLSDARPEMAGGAKLRLVFSTPLPQSEIDKLLEKIQGKLVDEPNSIGAYTIQLAASGLHRSDINSVVQWLRTQPKVVLAESILEP